MRGWRALAPVAIIALSAACADPEATARAYARDDQFARQLIVDLHAGGLAGVRDRIKPATLQGGPEVEAEFAMMMSGLPPGPIDSIRPLGGEIEQDGGTSVSKLSYRVFGAQRAARVDL